jgi:hypothetical protein
VRTSCHIEGGKCKVAPNERRSFKMGCFGQATAESASSLEARVVSCQLKVQK